MSELIIRSDGTYIEDFSGELVPVKVHYTRLDAPSSIDTDHAVALEREAIAAWMVTPEVYDMWPDDMARLIRDGDHHANTPPNAQERG